MHARNAILARPSMRLTLIRDTAAATAAVVPGSPHSATIICTSVSNATQCRGAAPVACAESLAESTRTRAWLSSQITLSVDPAFLHCRKQCDNQRTVARVRPIPNALRYAHPITAPRRSAGMATSHVVVRSSAASAAAPPPARVTGARADTRVSHAVLATSSVSGAHLVPLQLPPRRAAGVATGM